MCHTYTFAKIRVTLFKRNEKYKSVINLTLDITFWNGCTCDKIQRYLENLTTKTHLYSNRISPRVQFPAILNTRLIINFDTFLILGSVKTRHNKLSPVASYNIQILIFNNHSFSDTFLVLGRTSIGNRSLRFLILLTEWSCRMFQVSCVL